MAVVKQVLTHQRKLQPIAGVPGEVRVQLKITGYGSNHRAIIGVQRVDPAQRRVEFRVSRQIERRAQRELMLRVGGLIERIIDVRLPRLDVQVLLQKGIPSMQRPGIRHLIVAGEFQAVSIALQAVGEVQTAERWSGVNVVLRISLY